MYLMLMYSTQDTFTLNSSANAKLQFLIKK